MTANPLLEAALAYAARGWPVFPCNPKNKQPLLAGDVDAAGKKVRGSGGLSKASTDPAQIRAWWKKWPSALIGLCTGHSTLDAGGLRLFVLDFDPRADDATGEVWTLDRLKTETEAQIGCALPPSLTALSPSDGAHLYLLQPEDDGLPINNRGNLPLHVDVRGIGGYVIAPPSVMAKDANKGQGGLRYRWHRKEPIGGIAKAPPELIAELRAPKRKPPKTGATNDLAADQAAAASPSPSRRESTGDVEEDAVRHYAERALEEECRLLAATPLGNRDNQSNASGFVIGQLVGAGALGRGEAEAALVAAVQGFGDPEARAKAIANGLDAGETQPRDLAPVRAAARERADRAGHRGDWSAGGAPGRPRAPSPPRFGHQAMSAPFRSGRVAGPDGGGGREEDHEAPGGAELERMKAVTAAWLERRLKYVEKTPKALTALAWSMGRRVAAGLLEEGAAKEAIWPAYDDVADLQHADIDRAIADGIARGFDFGPLRVGFKCAGYRLTDKGNAMRFRDRFGADFRFTVAKGWLGWDGRRWKVLDQDEKTLPAEVQAAVFETVDQIQNEGRMVADTGFKDDDNPHGLDRLFIISKTKTETAAGLLKKWGLTSESAGKLGCIANLARRWLTVSIEDFDCDPLALNVLNGTLRFARETMGDGTRQASFKLEPHRREDLNTRLAPVEFDPEATSPRYDALLAWAQPDEAVRRYLHQWGGYSASGLTGEQKLHFWYGLGGNGKSSIIDLWCHVLGDYSDTIGIESFMDQGIKKRGDQATPDLAKLGGVRLLRTSEPERTAKLNSALIKAVTGGEPMSVRALHRGFFNLRPLFKLTISGNHRPDIPDTDQGIWRRVRLVAWKMDIDHPPADAVDWPVKDEELTEKLKVAEPNGIFRHLVVGLADYLAEGLIEPEAVSRSTQSYREHSDPLARFMKLCTVPKAGASIQSSKLHKVFVAWARAAGETEWKQKGFSQAMTSKGYQKKASDGMHWLDLELVREVSDFTDDEGNVLERLPDFEKEDAAIAADAAERGRGPLPPPAVSRGPPDPSRPLLSGDYRDEEP